MEQYYFNSKTGQCEPFVYGGCGGNENKFGTFEKCKSTCGSKISCNLPAKSSHSCKKALRGMYYYNPQKGQCETYSNHYFDCGDATGFWRKRECQKICGSKSTSIQGTIIVLVMSKHASYRHICMTVHCPLFGGSTVDCYRNSNRLLLSIAEESAKLRSALLNQVLEQLIEEQGN